MKHFQFSLVHLWLLQRAVVHAAYFAKTGQDTFLPGRGIKLVWHNPHIWFMVWPEHTARTFRAHTPVIKKQCSLLCSILTHYFLLVHVLLGFMMLVKMQQLNINVKGLSPVKQFFLPLSLSLYLSPSFGESEKLFAINILNRAGAKYYPSNRVQGSKTISTFWYHLSQLQNISDGLTLKAYVRCEKCTVNVWFFALWC